MLSKRNKKINSDGSIKIYIWSMLFVCFLCFFSYGYLVWGAIDGVVRREGMEEEMSNLSSNVLDLESEYVKVKSSITMEQALEFGFVQVSNRKFVSRAVAPQNLSLLVDQN